MVGRLVSLLGWLPGRCEVLVSGRVGLLGKSSSRYIDYFSTEEAILPCSKRSVGSLSATLQSAVKGLSQLTRTDFFPFEHVSNLSSLARLGFRGKSAGLAGRPLMLQVPLTIHHVVLYLTRIGDNKSAHLPLDQINIITTSVDFGTTC